NALLAGAWIARRWPARLLLVVTSVACVAGPVWWGQRRIDAHKGGSTVRVALVQPNIPSEEKWDVAHQEKSIRTLSRLSHEAGDQVPKPDLLVWPETALPFYLRLEPAKLDRIFELLKSVNVPLLAGYPDATLSLSGGGVITHNAAGLLLPSRTIADPYEKIHLV